MIDFDPKKWTLEERLMTLVAYFDIFGLGLDQDFIKRNIFGNNKFEWTDIKKIVQESSELVLIDEKVYLKFRSDRHYTQNNQEQVGFLLKKALKWGKLFRKPSKFRNLELMNINGVNGKEIFSPANRNSGLFNL